MNLKTAFMGATIAASIAASSSGPPPPLDDNRSDEVKIAAFRAEKDASFKAAADSPILAANRSSFAGLAYYPFDAKYRVPALLVAEPSRAPLVITLQTSTNVPREMRRVGRLEFSLNGEKYTLTAFSDVDDRAMARLFVPFGDLTSGTETYRGGRYLDLTRTTTGFYDLDFNRAYHPFCVYNPTFECPVPPRENRLALAVRAGERLAK